MSDLEIRHNKEGYSYDLVGTVEGGEIVFASVNAGQLIKSEQEQDTEATGAPSEATPEPESTYPQSTSEAISGEPGNEPAAPQV